MQETLLQLKTASPRRPVTHLRMAEPLPREVADARLQEERIAKIREYEEFVNDRLKVDLKITLEQRDRIYAELGR